MKRLTLYTAMAAAAMTTTSTMASQAAVRTYVISGNSVCGDSTGNKNYFGNNSAYTGNQNAGNLFSGNNCSINDVLQMITSGNSSSNCQNSWNNSSTLPGTLENPLVPNCQGNSNNQIVPNLPDSSDFPSISGGSDSSDCVDILRPNLPSPDTQKPDIQNPDIQKPDTQNPDTQKPDIQKPDIQNPDTQKPDIQKPDTQNPDTQKPDTQKPDTQNPTPPSTDQNRSYAQQVIDLVNDERSKAGLSAVTEATDVSAAAAIRAQEITSNFSHTRPDGTYYNTVLDQSGISYWGSGENIAYGQKTPAEVMNGWMNSQGHRANILNASYTKIGVAYYQNSNGVTYWVQLFTY